MPSKKLVDTQNVALGGRSDVFWRTQKEFRDRFSKLRRPAFKSFPKALENIGDQQAVLQYFDLGGFEFGNWLNNDERYNFLLGCIISLIDLQSLTGIKKGGFKLISIAFGARGRFGGRSAAAHFEPASNAINLTKKHGVATLAHEYGHALDYILGGYVEQSKTQRSLSGGTKLASYVIRSTRPKTDLRGKMHDLLLSIVSDSNGKPSSFYKSITANSKSPYYRMSTEIFARTFEQWVTYKLRQKGVSNYYLSQPKYDNWMYLSDKEFKKVLPKMNALIKAMAKKAK